MERLTLDSSVFVAALREPEEKHNDCKKLLEDIIKGKFEAIEPYSVLVEIAAAVKRRTGSEALAQKVAGDLLSVETIVFEELMRTQAEKSTDLAIKTGLRGMDAIVAQTAKTNNCWLVSLDVEMLNLAQKFVKIKPLASLV